MNREMRNRLRGKIIELYGSQQEFSSVIGRSQQTITAKLAGRSKFSQDDIVDWSNALHLTESQVGEYFFASELQKN